MSVSYRRASDPTQGAEVYQYGLVAAATKPGSSPSHAGWASTTGGEWQRVRRFRNHEQVLAQITERILDGRLRVGDRLPSERGLVSALGVSRASVREALRVLESMGVIQATAGSGRDSGSFICDHAAGAFSDLLRMHMALFHFEPSDLVATRIQLERGSAAGAARIATASDASKLNDLVAAMELSAMTYSSFYELDTQFHVTIAHASRNPLAADLMQALCGVMRPEIEQEPRFADDPGRVMCQLSREHTDIVSAIGARQASIAADLVARHVAGLYDGVPSHF